MPSPRKIYPSFSLALTGANGSVVTLRDLGSAVSRTIHLHVPITQLPPPLPPLHSSPPAASPSSSPQPRAPLSSPPAASSSSNSQLLGATDTQFEGRLCYSANYATASDGDGREVGTTENHERASGSDESVGLLRRFAAVRF
ncbi:hypothetical protein FA13DRAFT_649139 [Coprinellus micaceus]|uniref:Uncharacterized protein n=1 Tax=Coprinellus micaceus TaxID=71717 RepID=A0A4Y7T7J9_COPMI|nr:hypothetical protein FA13DRAFT_649139 [Coprinellus micaceus]